MPSSCICPSVSVCVSFTLWYCVKTAKRRITQIMPYDGIFCSCRISTDKRVARFLCHSRATCYILNFEFGELNLTQFTHNVLKWSLINLLKSTFWYSIPFRNASMPNKWQSSIFGRVTAQFLLRDSMLSRYSVIMCLSACHTPVLY